MAVEKLRKQTICKYSARQKKIEERRIVNLAAVDKTWKQQPVIRDIIILKEMVVIRKLRLYLETTLFNYYFDIERDGHADTVKLFEAIGMGKYEGYTSEYVTLELRKTKEPKRNNMLDLIGMYNIYNLEVNPEAERLANVYLDNGIIPARYWLDSVHIAISSVHELDCVVSYNFEHINKPKTKVLVERVNFKENHKGIVICTSKEVLDDEL